MKKSLLGSTITWHSILVMSILLSAFIIPLLPPAWGKAPAWIGFTLIFFSAVLSLEKRKIYILFLSSIALIMGWCSAIFDWPYIADISRGLNVIFFSIVVFSLISQVATARIVTSKVILESISGYILLGILYSLVIAGIISRDPGAFNIPYEGAGAEASVYNLSYSLYFGFVTLATLGYGDIVPLKPYSRALTTFICISGQLYIAIIIATLVGKFASRKEQGAD
jgi:voltage-gated potassium channel